MPLESTKSFIYKIFALVTLGVAIALGLVVLHFFLAKAEILITANQMPVNIETQISVPISNIEQPSIVDEISSELDELAKLRNLILGLENGFQDDDNSAVPEDEIYQDTLLEAELLEINVKTTHAVIPAGEGTRIEEQSTGEVTIYNEANYNQGLVTTTRLLTPEGVLFRITKAVTVPAGGSVNVEAKADKNFTGEIGNIGPSTFTIPGLSLSKQKYVYAKSALPFKGGVKIIKTLSAEDFERARSEATVILQERALEEFSKLDLPILSGNIELIDIKHETDDQPGDQKSKLMLHSSAKAQALIFDQAPLLRATKYKLEDTLAQDQTILAFNSDSFYYEILEIDVVAAQAKIKTYLEGFAVLADGNSLINTAELVGLSSEDIQAILLQNNAVQEVQVKFSPFWVSHAPRLVSKIKIVLKDR